MTEPAPRDERRPSGELPSGGLDAGSLHAGALILETLASGVITPGEIAWITAHQGEFSRQEEAAALKLGRLMDQGRIQLGCRVQS